MLPEVVADYLETDYLQEAASVIVVLRQRFFKTCAYRGGSEDPDGMELYPHAAGKGKP